MPLDRGDSNARQERTIEMHSSFDKQTVLITGAAGGLGSALACQLADAGAGLMLLDKDSRGLDAVHDRIGDAGQEAPGLCPLDLAAAGPEELDQLAAILTEEFGGLNHLVHCAAAFDGLTPLDQVRPADWLECMQVNLNAAWLLTVHCLPLLKQQPNASITFVAEQERVSTGAYWGAYGVSKSAVRSLAAIFAEELAASGVRVLTAEPGPMRTALRARAYLAEDPGLQTSPDETASKLVRLIAGPG